MHRARKSTLGTHGLRPVRIDLTKSPALPLGSGLSPRLVRNGNVRPTPRLGSGRRISPIRMGNISSKDISLFFSSKKKVQSDIKSFNASKSRRCLYREEDCKNKVLNARQVVAPVKTAGRTLPKHSEKAVIDNSKIPKHASLKSQRSTGSSKRLLQPQQTAISTSDHQVQLTNTRGSAISRGTSSGFVKEIIATEHDHGAFLNNEGGIEIIINQMKEIAEQQKTILQENAKDLKEILLEAAAEQKIILQQIAEMQMSMLQDTRAMFAEVLQGQRNILRELKGSGFEQNETAEVSRTTSEFEFLCSERSMGNDCLLKDAQSNLNNQKSTLNKQSKSHQSNLNSEKSLDKKRTKSLGKEKENSTHRSGKKSLASYREMRKSYQFLQTPTYSARKLRTPRMNTPRSSLSFKVRAQLESLLD